MTRTSAELAAEKVAEIGLNLKGHALKVVWARPKPQGPQSPSKCLKSLSIYNLLLIFAVVEPAATTIDLSTAQPPPPPSISGKEKYPSQNPR